MQMDLCQRWNRRRDSYRPAGECITTTHYAVAPIPGDNEARAFVQKHHYSGSYPAARKRFGLYRHDTMVGVAVFSMPCRADVLTNQFGGHANDHLELGRFVLLDDVPANGETWFLGRCFAALRGEFRGILAFSDPVSRETSDGRLVKPGHIGTIYQAHNAAYDGRATARTLRVLPDGTVFSDRAASKIRKGDRGWRYAAAQLEAFGADHPESNAAWLNYWLMKLTRRVRHPGNHRYTWRLDQRRKHWFQDNPYPKADSPEAPCT